MTHKTKAIILRGVKYGETSLIVTAYTEQFGIQSYLLNGVRTSSSKGQGRANMFQPAALLDLVVYHNEFKNLQRIKEFRWEILYDDIYFNVFKNAVALFMVELLLKCLRQPESNTELFAFVEDAFLHLDQADEKVLANYPLFFALNFCAFLGFRISDEYAPNRSYLDLTQGVFLTVSPAHGNYLEGPYSDWISQFLKVQQPDDLLEIALNQEQRKVLLQACLQFYAFQIADFGIVKSVPVLQSVLSAG